MCEITQLIITMQCDSTAMKGSSERGPQLSSRGRVGGFTKDETSELFF